ncbi:MAG TPA: hypothetical protein VFB59_04705, partial [Candidatus Saccharimonadales bacterium]|nr:hypothetical protein [Candidatus Saccharimonadales bacterium]
NYHDLSVRERWGVENAFLKAVNAELGDLMALMPRYVRWNPSVRFQQRAGIQLVRWLNGAREYLGKTPKEAKALSAKEISERVMEPGVSKTRSGLADINEGADENRKELLDAKTAGEPAPLPGETRSKIASRARFARGASDAVFATTTYCIGREIIRLFTPEYQAEREAQAARMAGYGMSGTDQIKSGAQATNKEATLVANSEWDGEGEVPDAVNSVMYSRTVGDQVPKNPAYAQQIPWLNPALALGDWYPAFEQYNKIAGPLMMAGPLGGILEQLGIDIGTRELNDKVCNAIMNEYVQYGIAGVEVIVAVVSLGSTKGVTAAVKAGLELVFHAAVGYGLDRLQSMLIEWTVKEYANLYFTGLEQGADRFNTAYVAQSSIAQNGIRNVTYGRPMDLNEANQSQAVAMAELRAEYQKKPIMERYFAIDNPFSLTGLTVAKLPVSPSGVMNTTQNGAHIIGSILSSPFRLLGTIGNAIFPSKSAHAEGVAFDKSTYGVTQWGWSQAELDRIKNDSSFSLASMIGKVEPRLTELNERYAKCYDSNTFRLQIEEPKDATGKGICTKEFLSTDDALYWRYYNAMMFSASHLSGSV